MAPKKSSPANAGDLRTDIILLVGRVLMAVVFLPGGFNKLLGLGAFAASLEARGLPVSLSYLLALIGGGAEFFGALAVLFGFQIRCAAILMAIFVVVATGIAHRYWEFADPTTYRFQRSSFFKNVGIFAGFLFLFVSGGGRWSLDTMWKRR